VAEVIKDFLSFFFVPTSAVFPLFPFFGEPIVSHRIFVTPALLSQITPLSPLRFSWFPFFPPSFREFSPSYPVLPFSFGLKAAGSPYIIRSLAFSPPILPGCRAFLLNILNSAPCAVFFLNSFDFGLFFLRSSPW